VHWADVVGMAGVGCVLAAYFLLQSGRLPATAPAYSWLNIAGSAAILVSLGHAFNLASFVIQVAWIAISAWGLLRARAQRRLQRGFGPERDT
jgi:paired small multidrug resistance pump